MKEISLYNKLRKSVHLEWIREFALISGEGKKVSLKMGYDYKMINEKEKRNWFDHMNFEHFVWIMKNSEFYEDYEIKMSNDGMYFLFKRSLPFVLAMEKFWDER